MMKLYCLVPFIIGFLFTDTYDSRGKILTKHTGKNCNHISWDEFYQDSWELQKDENGIKVYSRTLPGTKWKQRMGTTIINSSLSGAVALIKDVQVGPEWIDRMILFKNLKEINNKEWITYSELEIPWPFENRDLITRNSISQDPVSKKLTITLTSEPEYIAIKSDKVRMGKSEGAWIFEPLENDKVKVTYVMWSEPGKFVLPQSFVTPLVVKSIHKTMKNMKRLVEKEKYRNSKLSFIL